MIINREQYQELRNKARLVPELEKEIKRLAEQITSETKNCKMGPWCKECQHIGHDKSKVGHNVALGGASYYIIDECAGEVYYCKRHLHEMCQEFEKDYYHES